VHEKLMLALSTSSGVAQVCATTAAGVTLFEYEIAEYKQQSARLLPELGACMSKHGLSGESFQGIAVNVGPGGFTSLRTACAVAQGLSVAWGLTCYPVSSFEIMLEQARAEGFSPQGVGCVLLDARLNEFYAAMCSETQGHLSQIDRHLLLSVQESIAEPYIFPLDWLLVDSPSEQILQAWVSPPDFRLSSVTVKALANRAWQLCAQGEGVLAHQCQPWYVREKVADTTAERLAIKHGKN
jgi:tRNA threonylcarbamoyladenosine biosynthesis protein TsaB